MAGFSHVAMKAATPPMAESRRKSYKNAGQSQLDGAFRCVPYKEELLGDVPILVLARCGPRTWIIEMTECHPSVDTRESRTAVELSN